MIVILYNIRSLHNVGSIFRTADAAGVEKIFLCGITPEPVDKFGRKRQRITKVSLGAEDYIPWEKCHSAARLIDKLKKQGCLILAIEQSKKSIPYYEFSPSQFCHSELVLESTKEMPKPSDAKALACRQVLHDGIAELPRKIVLVLGNEIRGLPHSVLNRADKILEIPMRGKKESLNVAVAFWIVAFHLARGAANN